MTDGKTALSILAAALQAALNAIDSDLTELAQRRAKDGNGVDNGNVGRDGIPPDSGGPVSPDGADASEP